MSGCRLSWRRALALDPESGVQPASPPVVNPAGWWRPGPAHTVVPMATLVRPHGEPARRYRRVPWSPRAWGQALYLFGGIPAQLAAPLLVVAGLLVRPRWLLPLLFLAVAVLAVPALPSHPRQPPR